MRYSKSMKKVLLFSLIFVCSITYAQNYDFVKYKRLSNLAHKHDSLGELSAAQVYYDSMLNAVDFYPYDYFNAFNTAWNLGDSLKANDYLIQGALKGLDISGWYNNEIDEFLTLEIGREYLEIKDSLINEHFKSIDKNYYDKLEKLVARDQSIRDRSPEMLYNDSLNFESLIQLSEQKGFPTFPLTGYGCNNAWLLLWHHRGLKFPISEQWKRITPLINLEIKNGNLDPDFLQMHVEFNEKNGYNSKQTTAPN